MKRPRLCSLCSQPMDPLGSVSLHGGSRAFACYSCNRGVLFSEESDKPKTMSLKTLLDIIDKEACS
jgi:hypothetical protein